MAASPLSPSQPDRPPDVPLVAPFSDTLKFEDGTTASSGDSGALPVRLEPGAIPIEGYALVRCLGSGAYGEVWEAVGPGGTAIALKCVRLEVDSRQVELRALEAMKSVRHPHLLTVSGHWLRGGMLMVAMDLGDKTLLDRLREVVAEGQPGGLPADELIEYMREAAKGIDYLHVQGLQHRDIKPQNILLVGGGVKVGDFGLAKALEKSVATASRGFTPAYAAPELFEERVSRWTDQYSLAVTYCQLRGNRLPFEGSMAQMIIGHLKGSPDLSMLPTEIEREVVARALFKEPEQRWSSCREFVAALTGVSSSLPHSPPTSAQLPRRNEPIYDASSAKKAQDWKLASRAKQTARRRWVGVAFAAIGLSAAGAVAYVVMTSGPQQYIAEQTNTEPSSPSPAADKTGGAKLKSSELGELKDPPPFPIQPTVATTKSKTSGSNSNVPPAKDVERENILESDWQAYLRARFSGKLLQFLYAEAPNKFGTWREMAETGDAKAQAIIASCYRKGSGVAQDDEAAINWSRKAAEQGCPVGQTDLGLMLEKGRGVARDESAAARWYRKAAEQGDGPAEVMLGNMLRDGRGVEKSQSEAVDWYRNAAELGVDAGQNNLAEAYTTGRGVERDDTLALTWYRKSAEQGYAVAQNNLGNCYRDGRGVTRDIAEATRWYRKAAGQYYLPGHMNLCLLSAVDWSCTALVLNKTYQSLENDWGVYQNARLIAKWRQFLSAEATSKFATWLALAEAGESRAQVFVGSCYLNGVGVPKDEAKAIQWLRRAAERNNAIALNHLGVCFASGRGVPKNYTEAVRLYRKAAEAGEPTGQVNLGLMLMRGRGLERDQSVALKWYRLAAEQGSAVAQFNLGQAHVQGWGVEIDPIEGVKWFRRCAAHKYAPAMYELGLCYEQGRGVEASRQSALNWFESTFRELKDLANVSEEGSNDYLLGLLYAHGRGVGKDEQEAFECFRKAAEQGDDRAEIRLGISYQQGLGVEKDESKAVQWYRKAAEKGNSAGQINLGNAYANGRGVGKDEAEAATWYRKAAEKGNTIGQNNLGQCYEYGRGVEKDEAEAVKWYRIAATQGDSYGQNNLGQMLASGRGVKKDEAKAVTWYRKAAEQGHAKAQHNLGYCYELGRGVEKDEAEAAKWYQKAAMKREKRLDELGQEK